MSPDLQSERPPAKVLVLGDPGALGETLVRRLSASTISLPGPRSSCVSATAITSPAQHQS